MKQEMDAAVRLLQEDSSDVGKAEANIMIEVCEALLKAASGQ